MEILCEVRNLQKSFWQGGKRLDVIRGMNLSIRRGEMLSIVGASGVGKSTLLHIIGTLDQPTGGEVYFGGENVFAMKEEELARFRGRSIGFVFQFHHLLPEFTALENVMMPGLIQGRSFREMDKLGTAILRGVGMIDRLQHKPAELSGGEQQRVALARALVLSPEMVLADEFTGNLDTENAEMVADLLFKLNEEKGAAVIIVTHDMAMAARFGTRYVMADGILHC